MFDCAIGTGIFGTGIVSLFCRNGGNPIPGGGPADISTFFFGDSVFVFTTGVGIVSNPGGLAGVGVSAFGCTRSNPGGGDLTCGLFALTLLLA